MLFFALIFFCDLLIPLSMVICGLLLIKRPPAKINNYYGYKSPRSKKSPQAWAFAQGCCGRLWLRLGGVLVPLSAAAHLPFIGSSAGVLGWASVVLIVIQSVFMLCPLLLVERALKQNFDESGLPLNKMSGR